MPGPCLIFADYFFWKMKNYTILPKALSWIVRCGLLFLFIMTLLRLALVISFAANGVGFSALLPAFWLGFRFDARMVGIVCLLLLLFSFIKKLHPFTSKSGKRLALIIWGLAVTVLGLFYTMDFANYAYLHQRLSGSILNFAQDASISATMMWQSYPIVKLLAALALGCIFLIGLIKVLYKKTAAKNTLPNKKNRLGWNTFFVLVLALAIFGRAGQYPLRWSDAFALGNDYAANVALNPIQSFFSSLSFRHATFNEKKVREHYAFMSSFLGVEKPDSIGLNFERHFAAGKGINNGQPMNVVLIICESFSAYKSSMWGNPLNTTPYIDSISRQGIFFDHCFSPSFGTARGVWTAMTGIADVMPSKTASRNPALVDQHNIMADFEGYEKLYFIGGSSSWANIRGLLINNIPGLQLFEQDDYASPKVDVWGISDKNLFLEANKRLSQQQKPFFAVIQTADNHRPYTIPAADAVGFVKLNPPIDTLKKYGFESAEEYNAFRYTDYCYQTFFRTAASQPYFNNTLFVMVGDHGIRGDAGNMFPRAWTAQGLTAMHVPLLFYAKNITQPARYSFPVSQMDISATIAGLCGIPYFTNAIGRNLLPNGQKPDSNQVHAAFIYDPDTQKPGIVYNGRYFGYTIDRQNAPDFVSTLNNDAITNADSLGRQYRQMTEALYETARYQLFHNKKKATK